MVHMVHEHQQDSYRHSTSTLVNHIHYGTHGTRTPARLISTRYIHIGESYSLRYTSRFISTQHIHIGESYSLRYTWYKNTNKIHIDTARPHWWIIFTMVQDHQQYSYRHSTSTLVNHIHYGTRSPRRLISTQHIHIGELIHHGTRTPTRFISTQRIHIVES